MNNKIPYTTFNNFVLRTPLISLDNLRELISKRRVDDNEIEKIFNNPIISEAIYLASPDFYGLAKKSFDDGYLKPKMRESILKYISRMSSRSTPFGLFAGCCLGKFGYTTDIFLGKTTKNNRYTRLDMNYLVALAQNLVRIDFIKNQLYFYPNNSFYKIGNKIRYVEYQYLNAQRNHFISSVDNSIYLEELLNKCKEGVKLNDLAKFLVDKGIDGKIATLFLDELIENQILVSQLEPALTGPEFLKQIIKVLEKVEYSQDIVSLLKEIKKEIKSLDNKVGNNTSRYQIISNKIKSLNTSFNNKFLFQTDLSINYKSNILSNTTVDNIKIGLYLLNKFTPNYLNENLANFKKSFYNRYEEEEVKLSLALDPEIGIGYAQTNELSDSNPLIDDIILPTVPDKLNKIELDGFQQFLLDKILKSGEDDSNIIEIQDNDLDDFPLNWDDLPDTLYVILELLHLDSKEMIKIIGAGGSSAASLLSRFGHGNKDIDGLTEQIIKKEEELHEDKILAEITHLPESRVGNILMRSAIRKYEIPYLARSLKKPNFQLPISDLMISIKGYGKIKIRSIKHNKEVIPKLTNAHNYHKNSLPIYHFLSDLQTQDKRNSLGISIERMLDKFNYVPRIVYKKIILQEATWTFDTSDIKSILTVFDNEKLFNVEVLKFLEVYNLPSEVKLIEGDNHLYVNFGNITSSRLLFRTVKNHTSFKLTEFLYNESSIVKGENGNYTNQIILPFYKN